MMHAGASRALSVLRGVAFRKMEGAGNDFVVLDARQSPGPRLNRARIAALLDRRFGVGGDGLLRIRPGVSGLDARVDYWNADGGRASFCGNGARCVAKLLLGENGGANTGEVRFRLERVVVRARRSDQGTTGKIDRNADERIAVSHPRPRALEMPGPGGPSVPRGAQPCFVDSGVPHWILRVDDLEAFDLAKWAPPIRRHASLGPAGANVDAVELGRDGIRVRTWERGVEGETLACGSGLLAVAWWASEVLGRPFPIHLRTVGGAAFRAIPDGPQRLWLEGPAREVFQGAIP